MLKIYTDKVTKINQSTILEEKNNQILVYGYESLGKVSYKYELSGVAQSFKPAFTMPVSDMSILTNVPVIGLITASLSIFYSFQ